MVSTFGFLLALQSEIPLKAAGNLKALASQAVGLFGAGRLKQLKDELFRVNADIATVQQQIADARRKCDMEVVRLNQEKDDLRKRTDAEIARYNRENDDCRQKKKQVEDDCRQRRQQIELEIDRYRQALNQKIQQRGRLLKNWKRIQVQLVDSKYVDVSEVDIHGGGAEWIYAYTFPHHEQLAVANNDTRYPMKVGMSTQGNVVDRIDQQISGTSTTSRAVLRVVFRINDAMDFERYLHKKLKDIGRHKSDAIGKEWFNTNQRELEQLFQDFLLAED